MRGPLTIACLLAHACTGPHPIAVRTVGTHPKIAREPKDPPELVDARPWEVELVVERAISYPSDLDFGIPPCYRVTLVVREPSSAVRALPLGWAVGWRTRRELDKLPSFSTGGASFLLARHGEKLVAIRREFFDHPRAPPDGVVSQLGTVPVPSRAALVSARPSLPRHEAPGLSCMQDVYASLPDIWSGMGRPFSGSSSRRLRTIRPEHGTAPSRDRKTRRL